MKGAQHARDRKTATSPSVGHHRARHHGGDRRGRVLAATQGQCGEQPRPPRPREALAAAITLGKQFSADRRAVHQQEDQRLPLHLRNPNRMKVQILAFERDRPGHPRPGPERGA